MKEEILPIFDIQVAQQNELIILNKKITDHEEAMSDLYEELKRQPYMQGQALSKELKKEEISQVISKLNAKGENFDFVFLTSRLEIYQGLPQKNHQGGQPEKAGPAREGSSPQGKK